MKKKELVDKVIIETAGCTNWSHKELIERVLSLAEVYGMLPPKAEGVGKLYKVNSDGTIDEYRSRWED